MKHVFSLVQFKSFDPETRTFSGIATSPEPDRLGDSIKQIKFKNPLPLLLYHNSRQPVGEVRFKKQTPDGTPFDAVISKIDKPGAVKDRLDEAIHSLEANPPLIKGVSIGFRPLENPTYNKETDGFDFPLVEVLELSMVVIPAHQSATIRTVKELQDYAASLPASGTEDDDDATRPAPRAKTRVTTRSTGRQMAKKTIAEQRKEWEATRAAKSAELATLQAKTAESGDLPDDDENDQIDELVETIKKIDKHLARLNETEKLEKADAEAPLVEVDKKAGVPAARPRQVITVNRELPKGILFARYAMCLGMARGQEEQAINYAKKYYPDDPGIAALIEKTAVAGGSTAASHWLDDMVPYNVMNDFIEYLRPGSIVGKFGGPNPGGGPNYPSLRRVGFNERVSGMSTGFTAAWVGEGLPTLPSAAVTFNTSLLFHKLGAMAILTKEAVRFSNPSAEAQVRDDLARAVNAKMDLDFVDPAKAAVGTSSPASITDSIAAVAPTGTTAAKFRADMATILALFGANNLDPSDLVIIMSATQAAQLSMMINTLGNPDFGDLTIKGGSIMGIPVIVSEHLTAVGSPSTQTIVFVKAGDVYLADDGVATVEASDQASVEMVDTSSQSGISGTGASMVSLWQSGLIGLKCNREVTWKRRRTTAVQYLSPAAYVTQ